MLLTFDMVVNHTLNGKFKESTKNLLIMPKNSLALANVVFKEFFGKDDHDNGIGITQKLQPWHCNLRVGGLKLSAAIKLNSGGYCTQNN